MPTPRAPPRSAHSASSAAFASLSTTTGRPRRSLIRSRKRHVRRSGGASTSARRPSPTPPARGSRSPTASTSGAAARTSSTASTKMSSVSARSRSAPGAMHPVMHHEPLVHDPAEQLRSPRVDADHSPRRHGRTIYRGGVTDPKPGPSGVQGLPLRRKRPRAPRRRSRRAQAAARPRHREAARRAAATRSADHARPGASSGWRSPSAAGCCSRWCCSWSARRSQEGVSDDAEARALGRREHAQRQPTSSCSAPTPARASRSTRAQSGPSRADTIMLVHAGLGGVRKLSIPRDTEAEIPGHGSQQDQRRLRARRPRADDRTVENFLGNGLKINHLVEVDFKDFPALHRRAGRHHGRQQDAHLLAAVRQLLEGHPLPQGRDPPRRHAARSATRASARTRARPPRTTAPAPPASRRCCGRSAPRPSRPARSSACRGSAGRRPRRSRPT